MKIILVLCIVALSMVTGERMAKPTVDSAITHSSSGANMSNDFSKYATCTVAKADLDSKAETAWAAGHATPFPVLECENTGAYKAEVCTRTSKDSHALPTACWCVTKGGVEIAGTRANGKHVSCMAISTAKPATGLAEPRRSLRDPG